MFQDKRAEEPLWLGYMDFTRARVGVRSWAKRQEEVCLKFGQAVGKVKRSCLEKAIPPLRQPFSFTTISSYQEITRKQNNKQKMAFVCLFLQYSHFYWALIILTFLVWEFLFNDIMEWIVVPHWESSRAFCKNCDMQQEGSITYDCNFGVTIWTSLSCRTSLSGSSSWSWEVSIFEPQFPFM